MSLISAIKSGNERAFEEAYHRYHARLYLFFFRKTRSTYLSQELVQLSFIKLWTSRHTLSDVINIDIQLFTIARTSLIDLLRKENNEQKKLLELVSEISHRSNHALSIYLPNEEDNEALEQALRTLPPQRQKILRLHKQWDFSYKEIAQALKITPKTVENQVGKALKQLRRFMKG